MLVIACPGQGAQKSGFLTPWLELPGFTQRLSFLSDFAGIDLVGHGTESDDETLKDTAVAQPLLVAAAIATSAQLLGDLNATPDVVAGHSVGEIGAAVIAGVFGDDSAMTFVRTRAEGMAAASAATPTGMSAVVGGQTEDVLAAIEAAGLTAANVNGASQIVAAGTRENLQRLSENPPERARVIPLSVAGAFHTEFMAPAKAALSEVAGKLTASDPQLTLLSNAHGRPVKSGSEYVSLLVDQVTSPVRWDLCQEEMLAMGVTGILELAPAGTLVGLAKRAMKGVESFALKSPEDLDAAREFVSMHAGSAAK